MRQETSGKAQKPFCTERAAGQPVARPRVAATASTALLGEDLFSPAQVAARTTAVLAQVRELCVK